MAMTKLRMDGKAEVTAARGRFIVLNQKNSMGRGPGAARSIRNLRK